MVKVTLMSTTVKDLLAHFRKNTESAITSVTVLPATLY